MIGVSVLSGEQLTLVPQLVARVKEAGPDLAHVWVDAVFMGTLLEPAIEHVKEHARSWEG